MDARTLEALRQSISKWKMIAEGQYASRGASNCSLCRMFLGSNCCGCPVDSRTNNNGCTGTPIQWFNGAVWAESGELRERDVVWGPLSRAAAWAEYEFLKSLLSGKER